MVDSCWIRNFVNVETPTNHIWMKTRDFVDFEYGVFKVVGFIYIYGYLLCFYAHVETLINQELLTQSL